MAANQLAMGMIVLVAMSGSASARSPEPEAEVRISLIDSDRVGGTSLPAAMAVAAGILAATGARVHWSEGNKAGAIIIRFLDFAPEKQPRDILAEASPYATSGVRITVFLDRVWALANDQHLFKPRILGHVLAHEIVHVLRSTDAHSWTGVMKEHWDDADYRAMRTRGLTLAAEDVALTRASLTRSERILVLEKQ
jgi:hypothetical protein